MFRTVIIDDEAHNRDTLRKLLEQNCSQVSVIGKAASVESGIKSIKMLHPDLVFLDINLKDGTGFDVLQSIGPANFKTIFISAFGKEMIKTVRPGKLEYLNKPINPDDLIRAVRHAGKSVGFPYL